LVTADLVPIPQAVTDQASRRPQAEAVSGLSYRDLDEWARGIGVSLIEHGHGPGSSIAVALPAGHTHVAALLGILTAGAYFVPLNPSDPAGRGAEILADIGPACLLVAAAADDVSSPLAARFRQLGGQVMTVPARHGRPFVPVPTARLGLDAPAYVVHTSGSTGKPKAIRQSHRGLAQIAQWMGQEFAMGPGRRVAQWASTSYDASICEIFATLTAGGTVVPVPETIRTDAGRLVQWLTQESVHLLQTVPSFAREILHALDDAGTPVPSPLDSLLLAGEQLAGELAVKLRGALPGIRLVNLYGATETILATWMEVTRDWRDAVPIGAAIPGRQILVLDDQDRLCPVGSTGEIVVRSRYICSGYVTAGDDAEPRFGHLTVPGDSVAESATACYRTGDLGSWREDGWLEFRGRRDGQVKLHGIRVETAEIEAALRTHESVLDCAVVPEFLADGTVSTLIAYVVPRSAAGSPRAWRAHLTTRLNQSVIPSRFVVTEALPRNDGGKVDTARLPKVQEAKSSGARRLDAFRTWSAQLADGSVESNGETAS
jgi:amino acid adenylation domain-containing protein